QRTLEGRIRDAVRLVQLVREVVDRRLVRIHGDRPAAFGNVLGDGRIEPRFEGEAAVRVPLVLGSPEASRDDDRELVELRRQRAAEADLLAEALHPIADARTAQPYVEGP